MMAGEGRKRSLNLSLDFVHKEQQLGGYRTLNLLNSMGDPTYMRTVLYMQVARDYVPAPKANWARVVINGESWGVYVNVQQFNTDFTKEFFGATGGARWKVPVSMGRGAGGGLTYLGEAVDAYKRAYEIKSKDDPKSWADLTKLTKVLNETPPDKLEKALEPLLDIDGALKFLAVDKALINNDGYWTRASDFNIYQDPKGRFHVIPYDANETMSGSEGGRGGPGGGGGGFPFGGRGGMGGGGVDLDPFAGASDSNKPLLSRLLAVPSLRARYLGYIRDIAERWLDWSKVGPLAQQYQALSAADMKTDTRMSDTFDAFTKGVAEDTAEQDFGGFRGPGGANMSLKSFVEKRRAYLLSHAEVKAAAKPQ
jgi:spore coat protein CotH